MARMFFHVRDSAAYEAVDVGEIRTSIWSCAGCDEETFESQYRYLDEEFQGNGSFFPARSEDQREDSIRPKHFKMLNLELNRLYREVIACFTGDCLLLCTIGLRALVEKVCRDKGLTERNLEHRIDELSRFLPSPSLIEALHEFRFAGNAAAHELQALTRDEARMAIEVMEGLFNFLYDLDYKASQIRGASKKAASRPVTRGSVQ
jgi:hypothetical protein